MRKDFSTTTGMKDFSTTTAEIFENLEPPASHHHKPDYGKGYEIPGLEDDASSQPDVVDVIFISEFYSETEQVCSRKHLNQLHHDGFDFHVYHHYNLRNLPYLILSLSVFHKLRDAWAGQPYREKPSRNRPGIFSLILNRSKTTVRRR